MDQFEFLCVSGFLGTEMDARAIDSALRLGVLDALLAGAAALPTLAAQHRLNPTGLRLLIDMLEHNGVVARRGNRVELTGQFRTALRYRDLLVMRIEFADLVWPDLHHLFTTLLNDPQQFMARSRVFDLFRYDRCIDVTPANLAAARAWTRFTTCLSKYEAAAALEPIGLAEVRNFIDLGGNTGEFAVQACRRNQALRAIVVDLPVICEIGRRYIADAAADEAPRIAFLASDLRDGPLPEAADLVSFKSVLHDWPDAEARLLLHRASRLVRPGGRLLIFERAAIDFRARRIPYGLAPELTFLHFLRPADLYLAALAELGFAPIEHRRVPLEMDYHLIIAQRPA